MMKTGVFLGIASLFIQVAIADTAPGGEISVGQSLAEARAVLERNKIRFIDHYPFAVVVLDGSEVVAYDLDEELFLTLSIDPKTKVVRGISTKFVPNHRTSKTQVVDKEVRSVSFHSPSEYSIRFMRDLRTPEQRQQDFERFMKRVEEAAKKSSSKTEGGDKKEDTR